MAVFTTAISCARNQHSTSVLERHRKQIQSLNSCFSGLSDSLNSVNFCSTSEKTLLFSEIYFLLLWFLSCRFYFCDSWALLLTTLESQKYNYRMSMWKIYCRWMITMISALWFMDGFGILQEIVDHVETSQLETDMSFILKRGETSKVGNANLSFDQKGIWGIHWMQVMKHANKISTLTLKPRADVTGRPTYGLQKLYNSNFPYHCKPPSRISTCKLSFPHITTKCFQKPPIGSLTSHPRIWKNTCYQSMFFTTTY